MRKRVAREQALWYEEELNKEIEKKGNIKRIKNIWNCGRNIIC